VFLKIMLGILTKIFLYCMIFIKDSLLIKLPGEGPLPPSPITPYLAWGFYFIRR